MVIRLSSTAFTVYQKFFLRIRRLNHYRPMQRYYTDLCLTEWDYQLKTDGLMMKTRYIYNLYLKKYYGGFRVR